MNILFSPFCAKIPVQENNRVVGYKPSAKTPYYWKEFTAVVHATQKNWELLQIGAPDDEKLPHCGFFSPKIPSEAIKLIKQSDTWLCPDTWLQHLASPIKKGVVVWSRSDPKLFGYDTNINLLKDEKYIKPDPWSTWHQTEYIKEAFVDYEEIILALEKIEEEINGQKI